MNAWTSEEDAWWWALWTPDMAKEPGACPASTPDQASGDEHARKGKFDQWLAVSEALKLDGEGGEAEYDPVTGWGTAAGTVCPVIHSPEAVADEVMSLARVTPSDVVLDLGCGDGRVPIAAALKGATGVGVDINASLIRAAKRRAAESGIPEGRTRFGVRDFSDLSDADPMMEGVTVVYLYLLPEVLRMLRPLLDSLLDRGCRVVSLNHH
eukprot:CAMPEP_0114109100 /NCGR_PEP_ID=MMETSP0043_2-20121206/589_1 /TAXON_ID=464988 /ORGANISM="Hemiselmis andersenii, Strain CCMP644" /LENGTH=209 /DNA_ID=CAMNT_0001200941 /DNA_START=277 /DNA_END=903 /DNA_ORIENTATION=+